VYITVYVTDSFNWVRCFFNIFCKFPQPSDFQHTDHQHYSVSFPGKLSYILQLFLHLTGSVTTLVSEALYEALITKGLIRAAFIFIVLLSPVIKFKPIVFQPTVLSAAKYIMLSPMIVKNFCAELYARQCDPDMYHLI